MATLGYTPGTGAQIRTDLGSVTGSHMQVVKLAYGGAGIETLIPADQNGLWTHCTGIDGVVAITSAGTLNVQLLDATGTALGTPSNPLVVLNTPPANNSFWRFHYTYGANQTAIGLRTPTTGKTTYVLGFVITPTAVGQVTVYDSVDINTTELYNAKPGTSASVPIDYPIAFPLGGANRVLYLTTGAGAAGDITLWGYEQ